jgi:hypothetical protein
VVVAVAGLTQQVLQHLVAEVQVVELMLVKEQALQITELLEQMELEVGVVVVKKADQEQLSLDT